MSLTATSDDEFELEVAQFIYDCCLKLRLPQSTISVRCQIHYTNNFISLSDPSKVLASDLSSFFLHN